MIHPEEVRRRAQRFYERRKGEWVRDLVAEGLHRWGTSFRSTSTMGVGTEFTRVSGETLEVNLAPPTRHEVLQDIAGVGKWVNCWEEYAGPGKVIWEERRWPSVGTQRIPARIRFGDIEAIVRAASHAGEWHRLENRAGDIVRLSEEWQDGESPGIADTAKAGDLPDVVRRLANVIASTMDRDWEMALEVLRWLGKHRGLSCYIRELPIRGVDTKWIEGHRRLVLGLARSLYRLDELPFSRPPDLIRVRALGSGVFPEGFDDVSLTAAELSSLRTRPVRVVVCENLISVLTMPAMEGTIALFGSGYGAGSRLAIPWLDDVGLYYWGDLDTHGFRILDGFRKHHPHAASILMDGQTLRECEDLWVSEPEPFTGALARLTIEEMEVYDFLRHQHPVPRLEQERIPYRRVMTAFGAIAEDNH